MYPGTRSFSLWVYPGTHTHISYTGYWHYFVITHSPCRVPPPPITTGDQKNLLVNGELAGPVFNNAIPGWSTYHAKVTQIDYKGRTGVISVADAGGFSEIYQTVSTTPGQGFHISYDVSAKPIHNTAGKTYCSTTDSNGLLDIRQGAGQTNRHGEQRVCPVMAGQWTTVTGQYMATAKQTTFALHSESRYTAYFDRISVVPVGGVLPLTDQKSSQKPKPEVTDPEKLPPSQPVFNINDKPTVDVIKSKDGRSFAHMKFLKRDWYLVRRVPPGQTWHPANDQLAGTATYGKLSSDALSKAAAFSVPFAKLRWGEMLLASGDMRYWLVLDRSTVEECSTGKVNGQWHPPFIGASDASEGKVTQYCRAGAKEGE